jgi:hypothetical protein
MKGPAIRLPGSVPVERKLPDIGRELSGLKAGRTAFAGLIPIYDGIEP